MKGILFILILGIISIGSINGQKIEKKRTFASYQYYQEQSPLNVNQLEREMRHLPEAYKLIQKAKASSVIVSIASYAGGFLIGWPIGTAIAGGEPNWGLAGIGAGSLVLAFTFVTSYSSKLNKAVDIYNASLENISDGRLKPSLKFVASANCIGLRLVF